jgi:uncharacterized protein (TIGR00106 family)
MEGPVGILLLARISARRRHHLSRIGCSGGDVLAAFSVTPIGAADSVGDAVAEAVAVVRASGLPNETNAMFTNVEGDWDEVMGVIRRCVDAVSAHAPRVSVVIKVDHRPGTHGALQAKVESVERRLVGGAAGSREGRTVPGGEGR